MVLLRQVVFVFLLAISSVQSQSLSLSHAEEVNGVVGASTATEATGALSDENILEISDADDTNRDNNSKHDYDFNVSADISPLMISSSTLSSSDSALASASDSDSAIMLRGGGTAAAAAAVALSLPPIPPIHPHHTGSVHYSSIMNNNHISYRRDITAPCDNGMLVFTVGVAAKELPYEYDLYNEAYLWSDNAGLCIFYPMYSGYQLSNTPFWTLGIDPETVTFTNLIIDPSSMHRVSSRQLHNIKDPTSDGIDKNKLGDYVIMAHHDFYNIAYYKQLKAYINSLKTKTTTTTTTKEITSSTK